MGHRRLRNVVGTPPPPRLNLGLTLRRKVEPGEAPAAAPAGETCVPHFEGWVVSTVPEVITDQDIIDGFQIVIAPNPANDVCGGCLEWVGTVLYVLSPGDPEITSATPAEDCVGVVATIAPQPSWNATGTFILVFAATLNGEPYGTVVHYLPDTEQVLCFETTGDGIGTPDVPGAPVWGYPLGQDWVITVTYKGPYFGSGVLAWNPSEPAGTHPDVSYVEGVDGFSNATLTITHVNTGGPGFYPEDAAWYLTTAPTIDGTPIDALACFYEAGSWSLVQQ